MIRYRRFDRRDRRAGYPVVELNRVDGKRLANGFRDVLQDPTQFVTDHVLILLCLPIETMAAAVRTSIVCRTLQLGVRLWTCVKAEWVNVALNMLTPSHAGGGPGRSTS